MNRAKWMLYLKSSMVRNDLRQAARTCDFRICPDSYAWNRITDHREPFSMSFDSSRLTSTMFTIQIIARTMKRSLQSEAKGRSGTKTPPVRKGTTNRYSAYISTMNRTIARFVHPRYRCPRPGMIARMIAASSLLSFITIINHTPRTCPSLPPTQSPATAFHHRLR